MPYFEEGVPSPWLLCLWPELRARHLQELDLPVSYFLCSLFISSPSFPVPTQPLSQGQWYLSLPLESMWSAHGMVISGPSSLPVYGHLIHRNTIPTSPVYMSLSPPAPFLPSPEFLVHPLLIFQSAEFKTVELPSSSLPYSTFWSLPHLTKLKSLWFLLGKIFSGPPKTPPWLSSCRPCREHLKGRRRVWLNALSPMETSIVPHSQLRVHKCSLEWMFSCFGGAPRAKHKRVEGEVEGPDIHGGVVLVTSCWQQERHRNRAESFALTSGTASCHSQNTWSTRACGWAGTKQAKGKERVLLSLLPSVCYFLGFFCTVSQAVPRQF